MLTKGGDLLRLKAPTGTPPAATDKDVIVIGQPAPKSGVNAQTAALLELFESQGAQPFERIGLLRTRRVVGLAVGLQGERSPVGAVRDLLIDGPDGRVPVRVYSPETPDARRVLIVYLHGGGWSTGSVDVADRPVRMLAAATGATIASVDYRLAPETPFPGPLEDCYAAVQWLAERAADLGVDPRRIVIVGDSAGANLAAATALLSKERGGHPIAHQVLLYPCLLPARGSPFDSYRDNASGYSLTAATMAWFWSLYLRHESDGDNPLAAPLRAEDLSGLPSATVVTAQFDPLRDEGRAYAARLKAAGVDTELVEYAGTIHGFFWMAGHLEQATQVAAAIGAVLDGRFSPLPLTLPLALPA